MYIRVMCNNAVAVFVFSKIVSAQPLYYSVFSCVVQLLNCKRGLAHLVWNVAVKEVFMHFLHSSS